MLGQVGLALNSLVKRSGDAYRRRRHAQGLNRSTGAGRDASFNHWNEATDLIGNTWDYSNFVRDPCASGGKRAVFRGTERLPNSPIELDSYSNVLIAAVPLFDSAGFGFESRGAHQVREGKPNSGPISTQ